MLTPEPGLQAREDSSCPCQSTNMRGGSEAVEHLVLNRLDQLPCSGNVSYAPAPTQFAKLLSKLLPLFLAYNPRGRAHESASHSLEQTMAKHLHSNCHCRPSGYVAQPPGLGMTLSHRQSSILAPLHLLRPDPTDAAVHGHRTVAYACKAGNPHTQNNLSPTGCQELPSS